LERASSSFCEGMNGRCRGLLGTEREGSWAIEEGKVCGKLWVVCIVLCGRHLQCFHILRSRFLCSGLQYLLSSIDRDFIISDGSTVSRNCFGQVVCPFVTFQTLDLYLYLHLYSA
jgi:hypothetical protein